MTIHEEMISRTMRDLVEEELAEDPERSLEKFSDCLNGLNRCCLEIIQKRKSKKVLF